MCGISGVYNLNGRDLDYSHLAMMNDALIHRGPDHGDIYIRGHVGLTHRRLSIIDLSEAGHQPMQTEDKRFTIVYNGEVYNFNEIKENLKAYGVKFMSNTDTEVVLKAYQLWGKDCFQRFNGMFALAIYDSQTNELVLVRDQYGIKPLYFYSNGSRVVFGSEIKAIMRYPNINLTIKRESLTEYIWYGNPMGTNTIYNEIQEIDAGAYVVINESEVAHAKYFDINSITENSITEHEAIEQTKTLLQQSVKRHLISDVPVGIFLSGGIDSSAITAIAAKHYGDRINTYSVNFDFSDGPNELNKASIMAKKYGTQHNEMHISGGEIIPHIEALVNAHDGPFGDAADIPLYILTKELKGAIKVVLQGDGGDEIFGGYSIYNTLYNVRKWRLTKGLSNLISLSRTQNYQALRLQRFIDAITEDKASIRNAKLLTTETHLTNPLRIFNEDLKEELITKNPFQRYEEVYEGYADDQSLVQSAFYTDTQIILKDTFLEKVDKATMANSMEVRVPFLDKDLTEFVLSIPAKIKVKRGNQKYLLKKALEGMVPKEILYGKKTGFSVPYQYWLKTNLGEYFQDQISTKGVEPILNKEEILGLFELHRRGKGNYGFLLWKTLILAVWLNQNKFCVK